MRFRLLGINTELANFLAYEVKHYGEGKVYSYHIITWYAI